jgi:hypothetical protein
MRRRNHGPLHPLDTSPRFIAVDLERQLLPDTFEHALNSLIDSQHDLSGFDRRYKNDQTGASAYPPAMLLKVVLFAYSRVSSVAARSSAPAASRSPSLPCPVTAPRISPPLRRLRQPPGRPDPPLFKDVLLICDRQGLSSSKMFAIDGVKLPHNVSMGRIWSVRGHYGDSSFQTYAACNVSIWL